MLAAAGLKREAEETAGCAAAEAKGEDATAGGEGDFSMKLWAPPKRNLGEAEEGSGGV